MKNLISIVGINENATLDKAYVSNIAVKYNIKQLWNNILNQLVVTHYEHLNKYDSNIGIQFVTRGSGKTTEYANFFADLKDKYLNSNISYVISKTPEQYEQEVYNLVGNEYTILTPYINARTKIKIRHNKCGYVYDTLPANFLIHGTRCPKCANNIRKIKNMKPYYWYIEQVKKLTGSEYSIKSKCLDADRKILMKHNICGHEWRVSVSSFLNGTRCPVCSNINRKQTNKRTHEQYVSIIKQLYGNDYTILSPYVNANKKILVRHNLCNYEWYIRAQSLLKKAICPKCHGVLHYNQEDYINKVKELVGNDYIVLGQYVNARTKILMKHRLCGCKYYVTPAAFIRGSRCPECAISNRKKNIHTHH